MPRFSDEWVVDRVLFDYVSGGSCACCGISHSMFLPNGINDYITSMTDLETDQMNTEMEILASDLHPWPKVLRDQIWCDRVKLKQKLKSTISKYTTFWCQHGTPFTEWLLMIPSMSSSSSTSSSPTPSTPSSSIDHTNNTTEREHLENHTNHEKAQRLQRCIQMSRDEFISYIQQEFNIHSAYMVVLTAVMEQVAHFPETKYPLDSLRSSSSSHHTDENDNNKDHQAELHFEEILHFGRMSGFTLPITVEATAAMMKGTNDPADPKKEMNFRSEVVQILLDRIRTLGNTKLLGRGPSTTTNRSSNTKNQLRTLNRKNADDDDDDDDDDELENVDEEDDDDVDGPTSRKEIAAVVHPSSTTFTKCGIPTPSFQSDRRMIRLILARYWADVLIQRYYTDTQTAVRHDKDNDPS